MFTITIWDPIVSLSSISATTYYGDGSNLSGIPDYYVTGGTYSNGSLTLNRQNGIVTVTGFSTTGTTEVFSNTGGSNIDWLGSNLGINQLSVNWTNDLYIVVSTQCTVAADSTNARSSFIKIKR